MCAWFCMCTLKAKSRGQARVDRRKKVGTRMGKKELPCRPARFYSLLRIMVLETGGLKLKIIH